MKKFLFVVMIAACGGGGSGVDGGKKVAMLSASEQMTECTYEVNQFPKRTIMCPGSTQTETVGGGTVESCVTNLQSESTSHPNCGATVSQFEACEEDIFAEPDSFFCSSTATPPPSCAPLMGTDCN
jgi:hypothetical protein